MVLSGFSIADVPTIDELKITVKRPDSAQLTPLVLKFTWEEPYDSTVLEGETQFSMEKNKAFLTQLGNWSKNLKLNSAEYRNGAFYEQPAHLTHTGVFLANFSLTNGEKTQEKIKEMTFTFMLGVSKGNEVIFVDLLEQEQVPDLEDPAAIKSAKAAQRLEIDGSTSSVTIQGKKMALKAVRRTFDDFENIEFIAGQTRKWFKQKNPDIAYELRKCEIVEKNYHTFTASCEGVTKSKMDKTFACRYVYRLTQGMLFIDSQFCDFL